MTLKKDQRVLVRAVGGKDWCKSIVILASKPGPVQSIALLLDGAVRLSDGGLMAGALPLTLDNGKITGLLGEEYEIDDGQYLAMYVIYRFPLDYPGKWVLRRHTVAVTGAFPDEEPLAVTDELAECREMLPPCLTNLGRDVNDEPQIYEVWI